MKAVYQLNQEKLLYNVRILQERSFENSASIHDLTKRKRTLKDFYLSLVSKI